MDSRITIKFTKSTSCLDRNKKWSENWQRKIAKRRCWANIKRTSIINLKFNLKAEEVMRQYNLYGYVECSALTGKNLKKCFDEAIKAVLKKRTQPSIRKQRKMCSIL